MEKQEKAKQQEEAKAKGEQPPAKAESSNGGRITGEDASIREQHTNQKPLSTFHSSQPSGTGGDGPVSTSVPKRRTYSTSGLSSRSSKEQAAIRPASLGSNFPHLIERKLRQSNSSEHTLSSTQPSQDENRVPKELAQAQLRDIREKDGTGRISSTPTETLIITIDEAPATTPSSAAQPILIDGGLNQRHHHEKTLSSSAPDKASFIS